MPRFHDMMLVDVKGVKWTLLALLGVAALCVLDLRCSSARDRAKAEEGAPAQNVMSHVRKEIAAGRHEQAVMREDQINEQLRDMRVISRRLVKAGRMRDARRVMNSIQELEAMKKRLQAQQSRMEQMSK